MRRRIRMRGEGGRGGRGRMLPSLLTVPLGSLVLLSYTKMAAAQTTGLNSNSPAPRHFASGSDARQPRSINAMKSDADALGHLAFEGAAKRALPQPRMHATLTGVGSRLYLFGGTAEVEQPSRSFYLNELHVFDAHHGDWSDELSRPWCCEHNVVVDGLDPRPAPRTQHAAAAVGTSVFVFGGLTDRTGYNEEPLNRIRYSEYEADERGRKETSHGFARQGGGHRELYLNDLHVFDTLTHSWTGKKAVVGRAPSPRASHAMVAIGGDGGAPLSSSSSSYSTTARSSAASVNAGGPFANARSAASTAHSPALYVFGGRSGSQLLNDLHRLDTGRMEWTHIDVSSSARSAVPSPRHYFGFAAVADRFLFVSGGLWQDEATTELPVADDLGTFAVVTARTNRGGIDVEVGNWGDGDHHNDTAAAVAVPLGGLYAFDTVSGQWELRGLEAEALTLQLHPSPIGGSAAESKVATAAFSSSSLDSSIPTSSKGGTSSMNVKERDGVNDRQPSPRFNHALVAIPPVAGLGGADGYGYSMRGGGDACRRAQKRVTLGGGYGAGRSSSTDNTGCGWGLAVVGGVHGAHGVDLDEIGLYDVGRDQWHLNLMTGLTDVDAASSVADAKRISSSWREWTAATGGAGVNNKRASSIAAAVNTANTAATAADAWRAAAAAAAANEAAAPGSASGAGGAAAAATMSTNMAAVQAGRAAAAAAAVKGVEGLGPWQDPTAEYGNFEAFGPFVGRGYDGSAPEYQQTDARGMLHRPGAVRVEGRPEAKQGSGSGMGADHVIRATPSALATRPEPRIGQAHCVLLDRLWEFGGRRAIVTPSTVKALAKKAANAATQGGGAGVSAGGGGGVGSSADFVSDLHIYSRARTPSWSGRPHGDGANSGRDHSPTLVPPVRDLYVYSGVVRANGTKI